MQPSFNLPFQGIFVFSAPLAQEHLLNQRSVLFGPIRLLAKANCYRPATHQLHFISHPAH